MIPFIPPTGRNQIDITPIFEEADRTNGGCFYKALAIQAIIIIILITEIYLIK